MSGILAKYADLQILDDRSRTNELLQGLAQLTEYQHSDYYAGNAFVGQAILKDSPGEQPAVLEVVIAGDGVDSFATLFKPHPLFNNRDTYREGREEMLHCILDIANASVLGVKVMCPLRKRAVHVRDLGVKQLLELIQSAVNTFSGQGSQAVH